MIVDLTVPLEEDMPTLPGLQGFQPEALATYEQNGNLVHTFCTNTHQGTHVDAPAHYVEGGKTVDELELDLLMGQAAVVDLRRHRGGPITADRLAESASDSGLPGDRVLLLTGDMDESFYTDESFFENAAHLTPDAAEWLVDQDVSLIANDFMTEAVPGDPNRPVHNRLLAAGIPIVEYIHNTEAIVEEPTVRFNCLPILTPGLEAAPARVYAEL